MNTETLALDFKSATLYSVRVVLHSADIGRLTEALQKRMTDAGSFFENEPVVIDASRLQEALDWPALLEALRKYKLPPIGVVAEGDLLASARAAGLVSVELSTPPARPAQNNAAVTSGELDVPVPSIAAAAVAEDVAPAPALEITSEEGVAMPADEASEEPMVNGKPRLTRAARAAAGAVPAPARDPQSSSALVITKPLRSGQRVYARHCDLVVIGMVSQGAEVIADGNVHVYGPLRGKAMAGARGDTSARIFTTHMDAELLAIAGVYRVVEARLDPALHNHPALVRLEGDTLHIEGLKA
jgi:septum site-determining protein MinC